MELFDLVFYLFELIGTAAFAVSGALAAIERRLDIFGVTLIGATTALGGGIMRDVIIGDIPPRMFSRYEYALIAVLFSVAVFAIARLNREKYAASAPFIENINNVFDSIGLGIFSVAGVRVAVAAGFLSNAFLAVFLGVITGIGGGILRDVMIQKTPFVLRKRVYAVASMAGSACYLAFLRLGIDENAALICAVGLTFGLRMLATKFEWNLPRAL